MSTARLLRVSLANPPHPVVAGLCLARGTQKHPDRRIGEHELFFVRRGRLPIAEDGVNLETREGETLILWPHRRHYGTEIVSQGCEFYWFHFIVPPAIEHGPALMVPQRARPSRPQRLMELLHGYLNDQQAGLLTDISGSLLTMLMLSEIAEPRQGEDVHVGLVSRAEAEIARHFHQPIGTDGIARILGCNPDYLGRTYRRLYGRTIMDAIGHRRVIEAQRLLLDNASSSIESVAHLCGYRNLAWFRRQFKRIAGTTPDAYRRAHARAHINS